MKHIHYNEETGRVVRISHNNDEKLNDNGVITVDELPQRPKTDADERSTLCVVDGELEYEITKRDARAGEAIEPVDRKKISEDTKEELLSAIENGDTQRGLEYVADILDVIDHDARNTDN